MKPIYLVFPLLAVLAGCSSTNHYHNSQPGYRDYPQNYRHSYPQQYSSTYTETVTIVDLRPMNVQGKTSGGGAAVGALVGGVLGHQVGKGTGRDLATVGGAIAGAIAGNEMERNRTPDQVKYEFTFQFPNGERRVMVLDQRGYYRVGDRVRVTIQNGQIIAVN
ncbi:glycine zipper 2TM domain-containing protein [Undibacterium squillarum]|uniref:Glycine zipper 2TM domain-containing protein n=1 Tax=Undibacterium squillarum TaxID=1131567 RepID=A0ABQ2XS12_9BURK|nr:glycine zipper 2TM domain-containing protein [Undibacterium squillarum]GGX29814.1 hypothetical protein GCM10010946_03470 [Undibacterium squillarum]